jgi:integrase
VSIEVKALQSKVFRNLRSNRSRLNDIIVDAVCYVFTRVSTIERDRIEIEMGKSKSPRGTVVVQSFKDRLRLVWSYGQKRYFYSLGLPDNRVNQIVAQAKAKLIEGDLATGNFDPTLNKYKPESVRSDRQSLLEIFAKFIRYKSQEVEPVTLVKYQALANHLQENFDNKAASLITEADARTFKDWCLNRMADITFKDYLSLLKSCWKWGMKQGWLKVNPWEDIKIKIAPKQKPKPFTSEEISQILAGFRASESYSYYADYVEFVLSVGCRLGEASALKWQHFDGRAIWIGESSSRGKVKAVKRNRDRTIVLNDRLIAMLVKRKGNNSDLSQIIFPSFEGHYIDDHNFRSRAWKTVLGEVGIDYRKPYTMRSTGISHLLDKGVSPLIVAEIAGHNVEVLYKHYAGNVQSNVALPDFLVDD